MPFYSYKCKECNHKFTELQAIDDDPVSVCPICGGITYKELGATIRGLTTRHKEFVYNFNTPDPYNEVLDAAKKAENTGLMTKADKRNIDIRLAGLKARKDRGLQTSVDYGDVGHPLERTDD